MTAQRGRAAAITLRSRYQLVASGRVSREKELNWGWEIWPILASEHDRVRLQEQLLDLQEEAVPLKDDLEEMLGSAANRTDSHATALEEEIGKAEDELVNHGVSQTKMDRVKKPKVETVKALPEKRKKGFKRGLARRR